MDTNALKKFAQEARRDLLAQVEARLEKVLHTDSVELREKLDVVNELRAQLDDKGKENLVEEVAYTWFNRFCALRYMDVNQVTKVGVVSPTPGFSQPEILQEAKQGIFDQDLRVDQAHVQGLLDGSIPSSNPEGEAYRLLLVAVCNSYAEKMDFLFSRIEGYTELLMPEDLLSTQSVLHSVREALIQAVCQDVEVIGWLYQFYISEKKDEVMGQKGAVSKEDIPAVTQLFTPHWIVRYMVENTLGRLWLLNHPGSKIQDRMEYYISPEGQETDFLKVDSPEELKILDPACGSGHILTYAFDLLYAIYEELGYDPLSIPRLILEKNLYGIEIDKRAAMLSSFALMMKAVEKDKRFFRRKVQPNILEMEDVSFEPQEVKAYMAKVGEDLWTQELWEGLQQFENAKTFGSLIRPALKDVTELRERLKAKGVFEELFLAETNRRVLKVLEMSEYLSPRYHVVVANPPYFSKGMDSKYKQFAKDHYPDFKKDAFAMFVKRNSGLAIEGGQLGFMTPFVWMFISSYEKMRNYIIDKQTITTLIQLEYSGFEGATVPICTFTLENQFKAEYKGGFIRLSYFRGSENQAPKTREAIANPDCGWFFKSSAVDFKKIPGAPIAYWVSENLLRVFDKCEALGNLVDARVGLMTSDNARFLRFWWEVSYSKILFIASTSVEAFESAKKWFPHNKGGPGRKWAGNQDYIVNWQFNGKEIKELVIEKYPYLNGDPNFVVHDDGFYFKPFISWSEITSSNNYFRYYPIGFTFNVKGMSAFPQDCSFEQLIMFCNSNLAKFLTKVINPSLSFGVRNFNSLPAALLPDKLISEDAQILIDIAQKDWDRYETSWNFEYSPMMSSIVSGVVFNIEKRYEFDREIIKKRVNQMKSLEEKNNSLITDFFDLGQDISLEVPIEEITLTSNPHYRYGVVYSEEELEIRQREDTMKELISYAVGCIFGRYSLDKPGLILANQGETVEDYYKALTPDPSPAGRGDGPIHVTYAPTETNVIPIVEGGWFPDGAAAQFKQFLRVTFGEENFAENMRFIEDALGKDLEKYFTRDFYKDHVKMYKKRPIYWLFSSPKGNFNALIYMHRYQPETVSVVLNQYLREYRDKLTAHRRNLERISSDAGASAREKSQALKEIEDISKTLAELKEYEDEILYPLASKQIQIDLDDGVVVNYAKFGKALKKI